MELLYAGSGNWNLQVALLNRCGWNLYTDQDTKRTYWSSQTSCLWAETPPSEYIVMQIAAPEFTTASSHSLSKLWGDIQRFVAVLRIIL